MTSYFSEILKVHDLDVDLHRDEVLGPVLDYLTLCPMGNYYFKSVCLYVLFIKDTKHVLQYAK